MGVRHVLAGSVTEGGPLILDVELVEAASGLVVSSGRYSLDASLGAFEKAADKASGEIAEQVVDRLAGGR